MYALAAHPEKQQKLFRSLMQALPPTSQPIASYSELQHIPYLRACLDESLRLHPPVRFGLPRRTTAEGAFIAGHHLPPNVTVSSSVHTLHHDENLFHNALEYVPERWTSDDPETSAKEAQNLKDFVLPFTLGGRACIGRNLAYMEISICLAALVMKYEWTISETAKAKYTHFERFNASPVELIVSGRARAA
jgi:benzoate 4-monooxygenase